MPVVETLTLKVDAKVKRALIDSLAKIGKEGEKGAKNADKLDKNIRKVSPAPINRLADAANRANGGLLNMVKSTTLMGYNLQGIVLVAINKLRSSFVDMTDQFNRVIGQMNLWTGSMEEARAATYRLQEVSIDTGWTLDDLSSSTTKLDVGFKNLGLSTNETIDIVRGLGLQFRAMGAEGKKLPKVIGNLSTIFQRDVVAFEKLESLLGRGRHEQLFQAIADQLIKIKGIDMNDFANKGKNAMMIVKAAMDAGVISGRDLQEVIVRIGKDAGKQSTIATEIGHGWNKLSEAITVVITRFDEATGFSNTLARGFSVLAEWIRDLAKGMGTLGSWLKGIKGVYSTLQPYLAAFVSYMIETVKETWKFIKVLYKFADAVGVISIVKGAISLLSIAFLGLWEAGKTVQGWFTSFFEWATEVVKSFYSWIARVVDRFEWLSKILKPIVETLKSLAGWKFPEVKPVSGGSTTTTGSKGGSTTGGSTTGGGTTGAVTVDQLQQRFGNIRGQQRNLGAAQAGGLTTGDQYIKQMARINTQYKDLLRTQAHDLKAKPALTAKIKAQIKATQGAADAYKLSTLSTQKAIDKAQEEIEAINTAFEAKDLTEQQRDQRLKTVNTRLKDLLVTHSVEIQTYDHLNVKVRELVKETGKAADRIKDQTEEEKKKSTLLKQQEALQKFLNKTLAATIDILAQNTGFLSGDRPLTQEAKSTWDALKEGNFVGAALQLGESAVQSISELFGGKNRHEKQQDKIFASSYDDYYYGKKRLDQLRGDEQITEQKFHQERVNIADRQQQFLEQNYDMLRDEQKKELQQRIAEFQDSRDWLKKMADKEQEQVDKMTQLQATMDQQKQLAEQQLQTQKMMLEREKEQLAVMTRERDAAILEARLQAQANRDSIAVQSFGSANASSSATPKIEVKVDMHGDIGNAVKTEMKSDTTGKAILNTMYQNADEYGEFTGGRVA